ncbi:MAG TPA: hypothetical protein VK745_26820 [Polyangiaceae bacterium]|nr:hypothetical protein [Polyangiaceae bacterium]
MLAQVEPREAQLAGHELLEIWLELRDPKQPCASRSEGMSLAV